MPRRKSTTPANTSPVIDAQKTDKGVTFKNDTSNPVTLSVFAEGINGSITLSPNATITVSEKDAAKFTKFVDKNLIVKI